MFCHGGLFAGIAEGCVLEVIVEWISDEVFHAQGHVFFDLLVAHNYKPKTKLFARTSRLKVLRNLLT